MVTLPFIQRRVSPLQFVCCWQQDFCAGNKLTLRLRLNRLHENFNGRRWPVWPAPIQRIGISNSAGEGSLLKIVWSSNDVLTVIYQLTKQAKLIIIVAHLLFLNVGRVVELLLFRLVLHPNNTIVGPI